MSWIDEAREEGLFRQLIWVVICTAIGIVISIAAAFIQVIYVESDNGSTVNTTTCVDFDYEGAEAFQEYQSNENGRAGSSPDFCKRREPITQSVGSRAKEVASGNMVIGGIFGFMIGIYVATRIHDKLRRH